MRSAVLAAALAGASLPLFADDETLRLRQDRARSEGQPVLLEAPAPAYPAELVKKRTVGCVTLGFTIGTDGVPDEFQVLDSKPAGAFDRAAIEGLYHWKFEPQGKPVPAIQELRFQPADAKWSHVKRAAPRCRVPMVTFRVASERQPARVTSMVRPYYPPAAVKAKRTRCVAVSFQVTPAGVADDYEFLPPAPSREFADAVIWALNQWQFEPAAAAGRAALAARFELVNEDRPGECALPPQYAVKAEGIGTR